MVSLKKKRQRHETDERESFTRPASVGNLHSPPRFDSILAVALADQFPTLDEIDLSVTRSVLSPARNNSFVFELKRHDERPLGPPPPSGFRFVPPFLDDHRTSDIIVRAARWIRQYSIDSPSLSEERRARKKIKRTRRGLRTCAECHRNGSMRKFSSRRMHARNTTRLANRLLRFFLLFFLQVVYRPLFRFRWGSLRC